MPPSSGVLPLASQFFGVGGGIKFGAVVAVFCREPHCHFWGDAGLFAKIEHPSRPTPRGGNPPPRDCREQPQREADQRRARIMITTALRRRMIKIPIPTASISCSALSVPGGRAPVSVSPSGRDAPAVRMSEGEHTTCSAQIRGKTSDAGAVRCIICPTRL